MGNVEAGKQFLYYFVKQGKKILINSNVQSLESFSCRYESTFEKVKNLAGKSVTKEVVSKSLVDTKDAVKDLGNQASGLLKGLVKDIKK